MDELWNSPHEIIPMIQDRLFDFIRIHISQIGGITPAKKIAAMGELYNVRTAWHGLGDTSPVGHTANLMLNLNVPSVFRKPPFRHHALVRCFRARRR